MKIYCGECIDASVLRDHPLTVIQCGSYNNSQMNYMTAFGLGMRSGFCSVIGLGSRLRETALVS